MKVIYILLVLILVSGQLFSQCPSATVTDVDICGNSSANITASSSSGNCSLKWYEYQYGGSEFHVGCNYTTPILSCDKTFYVEDTSTVIATNLSAGYSIAQAPLTGNGKMETYGYDHQTTYFDTDYDMVINSITIKYNRRTWSCNAGAIKVHLRTAEGVVTTYNVSEFCGSGQVTDVLPVNFSVPKGKGHKIYTTGAQDLVYFYDYGGDFDVNGPLDYTEGLHITGTDAGGDGYGAFYDWDVTLSNYCPRVPVNVVQTCNVTEICDNGIDDDCDGLIDCFDDECKVAGSTCDAFYFGQDAPECQIIPPVDPNFGLEEVWRTSDKIETRCAPVVGDLDGDGIPEVIANNSDSREQLYVFSGIDGATEVTISARVSGYSQSSGIADTDGDGLGEIYIVQDDRRLYCFESDGSPKSGFANNIVGFGNGQYENTWSPSFADFDGDGTPEVYVGNQIFSSITGAVLVNGGASNSQGSINLGDHSFPAAWDVLPDSYCSDCDGLELIAGNTVYSVNLSSGTMFIASQAPSNNGWSRDGKIALADWDGDGGMDIIVSTTCCGLGGAIYIWDPRKEEIVTQDAAGNPLVSEYVDVQTTKNTQVGNPSVADFDGDGLLELAMAGSDEYIVLDNDLSLKWKKPAVDNSNMTTSTAFDFEGDGKTEIVYRDENVLYIFDGETGNVKAQTPCGSATRTEQPIVVDVDGDGDAEIVCTCADNDGGGQGEVRVFHSNTNDWVNTRRVWHQHNYTPVYVNEDLTIPRSFQDKALLAKQDLFFAQSPVVDINGDPIFTGMSDAVPAIDSVVFNDCSDSEGMMYVSICNDDMISLIYDFPMSIYDGDPKSGGTLIKTVGVDTMGFNAYTSKCLQFPVSIPNGNYDLHLYVNDDGTSPLNAPNITLQECDLTNNSANTFVSCNSTCSLPTIQPISQNSDLELCGTVNEELKVVSDIGYYYKWFKDGVEVTTPMVNDSLLGAVDFGEYYVRVADDISNIDNPLCYLNSDTVVISMAQGININLGNDTTICQGATLSLDAGGNGVSYNWVTAETSQAITVDTAGTYFVEVTDANGCLAHDTIIVAVLDIGNLDLGNDTLVCGDFQLNLDAQLSGGTYLWSTNETTQLIEATSAGVYSVIVDLGGCQTSGQIEITQQVNPVVDLGSDQTVCQGTTVTLDAGNVGLNYLWSTGEVSQIIDVTNTDTLIALVTDANGCSGTDSVIVTVNPLPVVSLGNDTTICQGQVVTLNAQNAGFSYDWSNMESSQSIVVDQSGIYSVRVYATGCEATDEIDVTVQGSLNVDLGSDQAVCFGNTVMLDAGASGVNYLWSTGETSQTINISNSDTISVVVTDALGCQGSDTAIINVNPLPNVDLGQDLTICEGDTVILDAQNIGFNFDWNTSEVAQAIMVTQAGAYSVRVYGVGCEDTDDVVVSVQASPIVDLGDDISICEGEEVTLDAGNSLLSHIWSSGQNIQSITVDESGEFVATVTDVSGCLGRDTISVVVNSLPVVSITTGQSNICENENEVNFNVSPSGGTLTGSAVVNSVFDVQSSAIVVGQPNWVVYSFSDNNNCSSQDSVSVTVQSVPQKPIFNDTVICKDESVIYSYINTGLSSYSWKNSNQNELSSSSSFVIEEAGSYLLEVSNEFCSNTSDLFDVEKVEIEGLEVTADEEIILLGESTELTVDNPGEGYQYAWSDNSGILSNTSTVFVTPSEDSEYTLSVTYEGCEDTSKVFIEVLLPIEVPSMFTPNGDGLNDVWEISGLESHDNYVVRVYNRWGNIVFEGVNSFEGWNGQYNGEDLPFGVYYYVIEIKQGDLKPLSGDLTLMR